MKTYKHTQKESSRLNIQRMLLPLCCIVVLLLIGFNDIYGQACPPPSVGYVTDAFAIPSKDAYFTTPTIFGDTLVCSGSTTNITVMGNGYTGFLWSNGASTQSITIDRTGTYTVTVTNANGCALTNSITVLETPALIVSSSSTNVSCNGGSNGTATVTVTGGTSPYSFLWSNGSTVANQSALPAGTYNVTISDANSCMTTSSVTITEPVALIIAISPSGPTTFCQGGSVTLNAEGFSSYIWSNGATTSTITASTNGTYSVTVTNNNGCNGTDSMLVNVIPNPNLTITGPATICNGGTITLGTPSFSTYQWSNLATTQTILVTVAGTYRVTVSNANGCTGTASQTVTVAAFQNPTITANGPFSFCPGGSVVLSTGAYSSYIWSNSAITQSITVTTGGTYSVTVTNASGCTGAASKTVTVLAAPGPSMTAVGLNTYCSGTSSVTLKVGAFSSYYWSTGANTQSIVVPPNNPGTYSVTVTNANGCTGTTSIILSTSCIPASQLNTTGIAATTAIANWIQPSCLYGYTIRISKQNLNTWTNYTITPNTHFTFSALIHNTTYEWQIQTNCNVAQTNVSGFSASQTFTTLARLEDGETENVPSIFEVYPNPTDGLLNICFSSVNDKIYNLKLVDVTGRIILNENHKAAIGNNQYQLNLAAIAKGVYSLILQKDDIVLQKKIVVK